MNAYIPILDEDSPAGFVCNARWEHIGPSDVYGHTPPRKMPVVCPCVWCVAERFPVDDLVLGPVWGLDNDFQGMAAKLVGIYYARALEDVKTSDV